MVIAVSLFFIVTSKTVTPANAGAHTEDALTRLARIWTLSMDPGVRRDDGF
jgi:hypothetical protein